MRSRMIATGLAIGAGLAANAAPASANQGGLSVEPIAPGGGVSAEGPDFAPTPGGVPVEHSGRPSHLATVVRSIRNNMRHDTAIQSFTLDPASLDADAEDASIMVTPANSSDSNACIEIINPLALLSADGGRVVAYAGREGDSLCVISANRAEVTGFIGNVAVPVDVKAALTPHTLDLVPDTGVGAVGFTAENGAGFGMMP